MKILIRNLLATLILFATTTAIAQTEENNEYSSNITLGSVRRFKSQIFNETREIWVSVPSDFRTELKGQKFPVAIVLDGPDHFYSVVGMLDRFSRTAGSEVCPPMIVVGLVNTDRERDFNPNLNDDTFNKFLRQELLPFIDKQYPTEPFRILIGHSLAGLRTIHTAIFSEDLFRGYIAIDPSLGQRRNEWYNLARKQIENYYPEKSSIYIAMAQTMPGRMVQDTSGIKSDTTGYSNHMRRIMEFSEMESNRNTETRKNFFWEYFPSENHQSVTQKGMYEGIKFVFRWFKPQFYARFFDTDVTAENAAKMYADYYTDMTQKLGYAYLPPADETGLTEYLFYKNQPQKALAIAELILKYYPENETSKAIYDNVKWRTKKDIGKLLETLSIKDVIKICKKEINKNVPEYNISEDGLNRVGYQLMNQDKFDNALAIFKLNTELYPSSANVYDSYGECLLAMNKKAEAISAYKKSLELNPKNTNASKIIKSLE